jgi:hypothetical protein
LGGFQPALRILRNHFSSNPQFFCVYSPCISQKKRKPPIPGTHPINIRLQIPHSQHIIFWQQIGLLTTKPRTMKTLVNILETVLTALTFQKDKMPALIPVRVITKVHPAQRH